MPKIRLMLRLTTLALALSVIVSLLLLVKPLPTVHAFGGWDHCRDMNNNITRGNPGDMSGCTVQFMGTGSFLGSCFGNYRYSCANNIYTCVYIYENDAPCRPGGGGDTLPEAGDN